MRFLIDRDDGHTIKGWVVPDNPLAISRVRVSVDGRPMTEISATEIDHGVRGNGWHSTGQCRFEVNEENLPGLTGMRSLEIHDVENNVLVHRRSPRENLCPAKVVLVNTSIQPETGLQSGLYPHFRMSYFNIGKFSEETLSIALNSAGVTSCFLSGSILLPRYEPYIVLGEVLSMMLVHDPCVEMAARMLWLRDRSALAEDEAQNWRLGDLVEASRFAADYDYGNVKSLKRFFRMLPEPAYHLLFNPLTRQLGTRSPDDRVLPAISIIAVEVLSRIGLIGHRDHYEAFAATVFDRLGIQAAPPPPSPIPPQVLQLAERLRGLRVALDFLTFDEVISQAVRKSVARSWTA